ncbi:nitrogen fixation protein NifZ [Bradyrhizobium sp. USDA 4501]
MEDVSWSDRAAPLHVCQRAMHEERYMSGIVRDSDVVELDEPPVFSFSQKVRANRSIRNDGTFRGKEIGNILVKKGEIGYVISIGTFLQQFYIYGVEFLESGYRVGMKRKELEPVDACEEIDDLPLPEEAVS